METLTLAQLFDQSYDIYEQIQSSKIESKIETFNQTLQRLKCAENKLDELHIFSDNEDLNEVSSNELRYFVLYALTGWFHEFRPSTREQRLADVNLAIEYYIKFFELCKNYGLVREIPKKFDEIDQTNRRLPSQEDRQRKIEKLKARKNLEQSINKLRSMTHIDDETKRQLYNEQIRWWIEQSEEEISALKEERKLLNFTPEGFVENVNKPKSSLPVNGPFTILPSKERLYREAVGGRGYPSLPTMTVQEFYDDLMRQQATQEKSKEKSVELSDEQRDEIDDPIHRDNVRRMDEFKDDNPRGTGNRYNRS